MMSTQLPVPKHSVIFKEMDDGAVLYCTRSEVYFGLNPVAVRIWRLLQERPADLEALVRAVGEAFPDTPATGIRADLREFLSDLVEAELVAEPAATA